MTRATVRNAAKLFAVAAATALSIACRRHASEPRTDTIVWRPLGTWSGHASTQTDPFISDTGSLRITWATRNETAPGAGTFRVTLHSDVSGRPLLTAVDVRGVGRDVTYVNEDPRPFFLVVEASNLEWTLSADEAVAATAPTAAPLKRP
jgi:hypothetical protein